MTPRDIMVVAGARPNFMKIAPLLAELERRGQNPSFVHTGQHYSADMSDRILCDLGVRPPDYNLGVGSGSHAQQTARIMTAFEPVLWELRPGWLVVVGDVNSTLACSLVASKLKEEIGCRVAHVEAGLRSFDWRMPEEVNRVLTDHLSDLLLAPSRDAVDQLLKEGHPSERVVFVGNVMIDTLFSALPRARALNYPGLLGVRAGAFALATVHRPSNVDSRENLKAVLEGLVKIADEIPVIFPVHPRTRRNAMDFGLEPLLERLTAVEPIGYLEMISLVDGAKVVLTDSGGLQEETTALGVPCVTLREQTERPITLTEGTNRMAGWPLTADGIRQSFSDAARQLRFQPGERCPEGWDGHASHRIAEHLLN
jgi:UDP-N-acetylglucosamine 2-epimerase (non-hydrolysing)